MCRNAFLSRHKDYANVGSHIAICRQAHIKLEVSCNPEIIHPLVTMFLKNDYFCFIRLYSLCTYGVWTSKPFLLLCHVSRYSARKLIFAVVPMN